MKRRNRKKTIIFLIILFISIGFAYLSTNLFLSGTGIFSANSWDIYFDNVDEETYKTDIVSAASVSNKVTVNASINLKQPKSTYIMYADIVSEAMDNAIKETERRRTIQQNFNKEHNIIPKTIIKEIKEVVSNNISTEKTSKKMSKKEMTQTIESIEEQMRKAAKELDFERAMELRDILFELKGI